MFLKEKKSGNIKGRACADGWPQRNNSTKGTASAPTVQTESMLITECIEAMEGFDVAVCIGSVSHGTHGQRGTHVT